MDASVYDSLTVKEKECLRLVSSERKSAVIAEQLGIAVSTVETHLMSARRKMGGVSRFVAARLLQEHEAPHQPSTSHRMPMDAHPPSLRSADPTAVSTMEDRSLILCEDSRTFDHGSGSSPHQPPLEGRHYDLNRLNRVALIAFTLLALMVAGIASVPLSDAVQRVARSIFQQRTTG